MNLNMHFENSVLSETCPPSEDTNPENEAENDEDKESDNYEWRWGLVGNIVESHVYGENKETRYGTKQFSGGTKVFMAPSQWGDGYENIVVIGNARHSRRYIEVVIRSEYIENFRVQKVYKPAVLSLMKKSRYYWWTNSDEDHDYLVEFSNSLNSWKNREKLDDETSVTTETQSSNETERVAVEFTEEARAKVMDIIRHQAGIYMEKQIIQKVSSVTAVYDEDVDDLLMQLVSCRELSLIKDHSDHAKKVFCRCENEILYCLDAFEYSAHFANPIIDPTLSLNANDVRKWLETHTSDLSFASAYASVSQESFVLSFAPKISLNDVFIANYIMMWDKLEKEMREAILIRNSASAKEYGMYSENMIIEDFLMKNGFGKSGGWWIFPGLGDCVCLRRPLRVKYIGSDHRLIAGSEYEIEDIDGDSYTVVGIDDRGGAFPISDFKIAEQSIDYGK